MQFTELRLSYLAIFGIPYHYYHRIQYPIPRAVTLLLGLRHHHYGLPGSQPGNLHTRQPAQPGSLPTPAATPTREPVLEILKL